MKPYQDVRIYQNNMIVTEIIYDGIGRRLKCACMLTILKNLLFISVEIVWFCKVANQTLQPSWLAKKIEFFLLRFPETALKVTNLIYSDSLK